MDKEAAKARVAQLVERFREAEQSGAIKKSTTSQQADEVCRHAGVSNKVDWPWCNLVYCFP